MLVAVQWTQTTPKNWINFELNKNTAKAFAALAKKPVPPVTGVVPLDNQPGWIFDLCIQGVHFYGFDHVAVVPFQDQDALKIWCWNDDVEDDDPSSTPYKWGEYWELFNPAPDKRLPKNAFGTHPVNTVQHKTIFTEVEGLSDFSEQLTTSGPVEIKLWEEWVMPPEEMTFHGVWVRDTALWQKHFDVRSKRDWREWVK